MMGKVVAIIPARAGSKGIPRKNLRQICGLPLIAWSILQAQHSKLIDSVFVSSDGDEILDVAERFGAVPIRRPTEFSGDTVSSEFAWLHALEEIEQSGKTVDLIVGMQPTSPIREPFDLDEAIRKTKRESLDSLLSVAEVEDFFTWRIGKAGPEPVNYDYRTRKMRQVIEKRYLENGSFYIFRPDILRDQGNRLGGKIGIYIMARHKMFQIDNLEDIELCESIMQGYSLDKQ
jgi:N-acylneuraminate cytidylyltransferase